MYTSQHSVEQKLISSARLPARRKLDSLAWGMFALALGWAAQALFAADQLGPGLLLYAIALPLFAVRLATSWREEPHPPPNSPRLFNFSIRPGFRGQFGLGSIIGALILSCLSWYLFGYATSSSAAWYAYLASLLLFGLGVCLAGQTPDAPSSQAPESQASTILASRLDPWLMAILLLALFMRLFQFFSIPFGTWYDEATTGLEARRILEDPSFRPVFSMAMNQVADHLYLFALSFRLFGDNIAALRAVSVLFGMGGVLAAYLFGREYGGRRWGLLLAALVATMRWHINFSRIAMNGIDVPFFEFLTLYLALRALRGRPAPLRAISWLGLAVGLGLSFYTPYRLFIIVIALSGLVLLWHLFGRPRSIRGLLSEPITGPKSGQQFSQQLVTDLGIFLIALWLAATPTAQYAWRHSGSFWARARHVSIFQNRDEPNLALALAKNTGKHLLMFNYKGDNNGRHNLPGAPMLDRLSAILFALGIGLAVARRRPADLLFLALLLAGLLGGILTLDFESPQSLRSIAALPAVIYFIALSLDALWSELRWAARIEQPRYSLALAFLGLGVIAVTNGFTYFGPQAHDETVWKAFSTAETLVGEKIAELGPEPIYYLSPFFYDHVSVQFHAPIKSSRSERKVMPLPDPLPARESPDRPVVYFIHPDEAWVFDLAHQIYPTARFETLPDDKDYSPALYVVYLDPGQVASVQGLELRYWAGDSWDGPPQQATRTPLAEVVWPDDAPFPPPFRAEWRGVLYTPQYGQYTLGVEAPGKIELILDGETIEGSESISLVEHLAVGNHDLRLRAEAAPGRVRLWWQPPQDKDKETVPTWALYSFPINASGLLGKYYPNSNWEGAPSLERIDPTLNVYFHLTPLPRPYSVEWTGMLHIPESGVYGLGLRAVDQARLYLDDELVVDAAIPDLYTEQLLDLDAGLHKLRITYQDLTGRSRIHLYWSPLGTQPEIIPSKYLYPTQSLSRLSQLPAARSPTRALPPLDLKWQATWGSIGEEAGQFLEPHDVAVIGDTVFVADTGNRRVQAFSRDGTFLDARSGAEEPFEEPLALGVDNQNRLLVLDSPSGWIYRFDADASPLDRFGGPAIQAYHPRGMTVVGDRVIISDTGGGRILFLNSDGRIEGQFGGAGQALIQFEEPTDVALDQNGLYYVVEAYAHRLQRIDSQGRALNQWSIPPSIAHDGPHLAWGPDGSLLISAPEEGAILRYAPDGRLLGRWTQAGPSPLCRPVGMFVDAAARTLYVTDTACHQVYLFTLE